MKKWIGIAAAFIGILALSGCSSTGDIAVSRQIQLYANDLNEPGEPENGEWNGEYVYFGGMKWRFLGRSLNAGSGNLVLFLEQAPEEYEQQLRRPFLDQSVNGLQFWKNSELRKYVNDDFLKMAFSPEEQQLMEITTFYGSHDRLYPLSSWFFDEDWTDMGFGESNEGLSYKEAWWACGSAKPVRIEADGSYELDESIHSQELQRLEEPALFRPCCGIDKNRIAYFKDASLPVTMEVSSELLIFEQEAEPSGEWSPVVSSAAQHVTIEDVELDNGVCRFRYSDATTGEGNALYAVVRDWGGSDVYAYGKVADTSNSDSGTVEVELPDFYNRNMGLEIFSEKERTSPSGTAYASERVMILFGKDVEELPIVSEGKLDPGYIPLTGDPITSSYYDTFLLQWDYEACRNADEEELWDIGTALVLYQAILGGQVEEGELTDSDIEDAQEMMENYVEDVQALTENSIENMHMMGFDNLKETMDHANQVMQNLSEGEEIEEVDLGEYAPYLSYTYAEYQAADDEEQQRVIKAAVLYLFRYRLNIEISEEEALQEAQAGRMLQRAFEAMWEAYSYSDSVTLKDVLDR